MSSTNRAAPIRIAGGLVAALVVAAASTHPGTPAAAAARPDLVVKAISSPPASLAQGATFTAAVKVKNTGTARAKRSAVRFYLSGNNVKDASDILLEGPWPVRALDPGQARKGQADLTVPLDAPVGVARILACADDTNAVRESKERNNCKASAASVEIVPPTTSTDLIDAALIVGDINEETSIMYKVFATFGDSRLPAQYRGDDRLVFDTDALTEAAAAFDTLSAEARGTLAPFLMQPAYPGTWEELESSSTGADARPSTAAESPSTATTEVPTMHPSPLGQEGWWFYEHLRARIWFRLDVPSHEQVATAIFANLTEIHDDLTGLMGRQPLSDAGPHPFVDTDGNPQQWGDGGSGLLDVYVTPIRGVRGLTVAYPPGCTGRPSFMIVDPGVGQAAARYVAAHEFMHVLQFTYTYSAPCAEYESLDETTATWAIDYVFPGDNYEHQWETLMWYPEYKLWDQDEDGWVFPLYLEHTLGPAVIPAIYAETQSKGPWAAVDAALPGGLEERWPGFAYYAWNQEPVMPSFAAWDDLFDVPLAGYQTPLTAKIVSLGSQTSREFPIDISVSALARRYEPFSITDEVRWLGFENDLFGRPGASVQALIKLGDGSWRTEDWTDQQHVSFCREEPEEDVVEIVPIFANSNFADLSNVLNSSSTKLVARDRCPPPETFTGTFSGRGGPLSAVPHETWSGTVTFKLDELSPEGSGERTAHYGVSSGSVTWHVVPSPYTSNDCTVSPQSPQTDALKPFDFEKFATAGALTVYLDREPMEFRLLVSNNSYSGDPPTPDYPTMPADYVCTDPPRSGTSQIYPYCCAWLYTWDPSGPFRVGEDFRLEGRGGYDSQEWAWSLTPE